MHVCTVCGAKADIEMMDGAWYCETHDPLAAEEKHATHAKRDALVERLAELDHDLNVDRRVAHQDYRRLPEWQKQRHRNRVLRNIWPLFVEFTAEWIETQGQVLYRILPIESSSLSRHWHEEMTVNPKEGDL